MENMREKIINQAKKLSQKFKLRLKKKDITQDELVIKKLNISSIGLVEIENNFIQKSSLPMIIKITDDFEISLDDLMK